MHVPSITCKKKKYCIYQDLKVNTIKFVVIFVIFMVEWYQLVIVLRLNKFSKHVSFKETRF